MNRRLRTVREHIRLENAHDLPAVMDTFGASARYGEPTTLSGRLLLFLNHPVTL